MSAAELCENAHEGKGAMSGELPQDILFTVVREITTERLNSYGPGVASAPQEVAEEDMSYDHWIGEITLCFPSIEIAFRSHFSSKVARVFAVAMLGDEEPVAPGPARRRRERERLGETREAGRGAPHRARTRCRLPARGLV